MFTGKTVVIGVCSSSAVYKIATLIRLLKKQHAEVQVIMTENATQFFPPFAFARLAGSNCIVDTFNTNFTFNVAHISLSKKADVMIVAPASANTIAKMANGIADNFLTTTVLSSECPILVAPAMNPKMFWKPVTQNNLKKLEEYGMKLIGPGYGPLACGDVGKGRMSEPEELFEYIALEIAKEKDLAGKKVLVSAGPTVEAIDPVRFISNHSTGKMGYELARAAAYRGAEVTLVSGPTNLTTPVGVRRLDVTTADEMYDAVLDNFDNCDFVFKAAAVADYTPVVVSNQKIKKSDDTITIELKRTRDILAALGEKKKASQVVCGFSMETENLVENSKNKLSQKNADLIVANCLCEEGAGFGHDTNKATLIKKDSCEELSLMSKYDLANAIIDCVLK